MRVPTMILAAALIAVGNAWAIDFEKLVMPGPLIEGHADIEGDCAKCHAPFKVMEENARCVACHEDVSGDLAASKGFHGRSTGVKDATCRDCHSEHLGRDADILGLDRAAFDHRETDFALVGAHLASDCASCHEAGSRFREAPGACNDCHSAVDPHAGTLGTGCGDCHSEVAWGETRFDHSKTRFALTGEHREVACASCHPAERYERTATDCRSCHGLDDIHLGRFGSDCATCHSDAGWKRVRFEHGRDTKFALQGSHRAAACNACHQAGSPPPRPPSECVDCHRSDDEHRGRNGPDCEQCHGATRWEETIFDHDSATGFRLRGVHREAKCNQCHVETSAKAQGVRNCADCHAGDDVHHGQQGVACGDCHGEVAFSHEVFFEHDLARLPLLGMHAVVACEQCHATPKFKDASTDCHGCHAFDDVHREGLGPSCERCHNPNGWSLWRFDHGAETGFSLVGGHAELDCHTCHESGSRAAVTRAGCADCHARDDRHFGAFGRDCARCHGDTTWTDLEKIR